MTDNLLLLIAKILQLYIAVNERIKLEITDDI